MSEKMSHWELRGRHTELPAGLERSKTLAAAGFPAWHALMMTGDSGPEMSGEARVMIGARMDPYRSVLVLGLHQKHLVWEAQGIALVAHGVFAFGTSIWAMPSALPMLVPWCTLLHEEVGQLPA